MKFILKVNSKCSVRLCKLLIRNFFFTDRQYKKSVCTCQYNSQKADF
jgi:hypothetical protein